MKPTCGHPTDSGGPCKRTVAEPDKHCFMHTGNGAPSGHGAPPENDNAVGNSGGGAPVGNTNAEKHGAWNDPLKEYKRLGGKEKEYIDELTESIVKKSKANLPQKEIERKARYLAILMRQSHRGWAYAIHIEELEVKRKREVKGGMLVTWVLNPALEADSRRRSKQRKLSLELRTYPSPDGRPYSEH